MFHYSFSTVYMAVIASNVLLVLITISLSNKKIMVNIGYKLLTLFLILTALRFLLPVELPFTKTILLDDFKSVSHVISQIRHPLYTMGEWDISAWTVLQIVWLVGFVISALRYLQAHLKARYFILANCLEVTNTEPYHSLMDRVCQERHKKNNFQILTVSGINAPMIYGVFSPRILIPENIQLTEDELYYTLAHEASHHFRHDLLFKNVVKFIAMAYWWNPASHILIRQTSVLLEMRVDNMIAASGQEKIAEYIHSLCAIGERATEHASLPKAVTMSLLSEQEGDLIKRFYMLTSSGQKKNLWLNLALSALVICIYVMSYLFILEAHYANPETQATSIGQTEENSCAVLKEDGTYDIYYMQYFIENVESLEYYSSDIPIYTEEEFTNEEH